MALRKDEYIAKYGEEAWEVYAAKRKEYKEANKEHIRQQRKEYRMANKEQIKDYNEQYVNTPKGKAFKLKGNYIGMDKEKGLPTDQNIDETWIMENVFSGQRCIYCGESDWRKLGVDRLDNSKPHTPENCVPCCWDCNNERNNRYSPIEFQAMKFQEILGY